MRKYLTIMIITVCTGILYFTIRKNYLAYNSIVYISNTRWHKVRVQVRKGFNPDPLHDKLIFDQYLMMGQSRTFTVDNGDDILYRRDENPDHPDGIHFTKWVYVDCDGSSTCTLDNL